MRCADQETANQIGADTALDLAVSREALTRQIENETQAVKLWTGTTKELDAMRSRLLQEIAKSAPVVDYQSKLNEEQAAVIESLKRQREAADKVADANEQQAQEITKQTTGIRDSGKQTQQTFKKVAKQQTIAGNIANKAMRSISTFIGSQVDSLLDQIPLANEAKAVGSFVKSVIPKKQEPVKRILPRSKAMEAQPATTEPEEPQNAPESHTGLLKRRDEQGIGRVQRQQLAQLKHISKTTDSILKEVKDGFLASMLTKVLMMAAFSGLAKLLLALPGLFAAKMLPTRIPNGFKPGQKTPDPKPKPGAKTPEPKPTEQKPKDKPKAEPKTEQKPKDAKPQPEPAKKDPKVPGEKTQPKPEAPKADPKPQPKPEPGKPNKVPDVPKPEPRITPASKSGGGLLDKGKDLLSKGAKGAGKLAKGIPWLGTILFGLDVIDQQMEDPRNTGLGHARAIMDGNQDSYTGDYQGKPDAMERGEPPISSEGEKLDQAMEAKTLEEKKADLEQKALMAMYASKTASNTTVINNNTTMSGGSNSEIPAFGNEYQTPHQKGSMIQR